MHERINRLRSSPRKRGPRDHRTSFESLGPRFRGDERREFSQDRDAPGYPAAGVKMVCGAAVSPIAIPEAIIAAPLACQRHLARVRETQYSPFVPAQAG